MEAGGVVPAVDSPRGPCEVLSAAQGRGRDVWTDDLWDGDVPLPGAGDAALAEAQLGTALPIELHVEMIAMVDPAQSGHWRGPGTADGQHVLERDNDLQ